MAAPEQTACFLQDSFANNPFERISNKINKKKHTKIKIKNKNLKKENKKKQNSRSIRKNRTRWQHRLLPSPSRPAFLFARKKKKQRRRKSKKWMVPSSRAVILSAMSSSRPFRNGLKDVNMNICHRLAPIRVDAADLFRLCCIRSDGKQRPFWLRTSCFFFYRPDRPPCYNWTHRSFFSSIFHWRCRVYTSLWTFNNSEIRSAAAVNLWKC